MAEKTVPLKDFKALYERVNWFLGWLMQQEEDLSGFIINEWFRSDPSCTGSRARKIIRECEGDS